MPIEVAFRDHHDRQQRNRHERQSQDGCDPRTFRPQGRNLDEPGKERGAENGERWTCRQSAKIAPDEQESGETDHAHVYRSHGIAGKFS
jgi:hypothetical protein